MCAYRCDICCHIYMRQHYSRNRFHRLPRLSCGNKHFRNDPPIHQPCICIARSPHSRHIFRDTPASFACHFIPDPAGMDAFASELVAFARTLFPVRRPTIENVIDFLADFGDRKDGKAVGFQAAVQPCDVVERVAASRSSSATSSDTHSPPHSIVGEARRSRELTIYKISYKHYPCTQRHHRPRTRVPLPEQARMSHDVTARRMPSGIDAPHVRRMPSGIVAPDVRRMPSGIAAPQIQPHHKKTIDI